jgi:membrane-associated phospholipid phosphatase
MAAGLLLMPLPTPVGLGAQDRSPVLGARDAAIAGVFTTATVGALALDRPLAERLQRPESRAPGGVAATAVVFRHAAHPGVALALPTLWAIGRLVDDRTTAAVGLRGTEAVGVALVTVGSVKLLAGRARPSVPGRDPTSWRFARGIGQGSEYQSFPSGHTAVAFAAASAVTAELAARRTSLRWSAGVPLYLGAGAAGWARMYENRHWASDVVAGAAIGTLAGSAVARWHRTRPDNALDRRLLGAGVGLTPAGARLALVVLPAPARRAPR